MSRESLGGLGCQVLDGLPEGEAPTLAVVLCHGFGAPADDLVPIAAELLRTDPRMATVRFYLPAAPLDLELRGILGGRAWWWLDLDRLAQAGPAARLASLRADVPDGLPEARERLLALVAGVQAETGLPASRLVLGGFSQGAMLATDVALRMPEPPAAVCAFSGNLLCETEWVPLAAGHPPLPFLLCHGRQDPLLPFAGAEALRDLLETAGHEVTFLPFDGGHGIPHAALAAFAGLIALLA